MIWKVKWQAIVINVLSSQLEGIFLTMGRVFQNQGMGKEAWCGWWSSCFLPISTSVNSFSKFLSVFIIILLFIVYLSYSLIKLGSGAISVGLALRILYLWGTMQTCLSSVSLNGFYYTFLIHSLDWVPWRHMDSVFMIFVLAQWFSPIGTLKNMNSHLRNDCACL